MIITAEPINRPAKEDCLISNPMDSEGSIVPNRILIHVFKDCISNIKDHLSGTYLFLLADQEGKLLAMDYSRNLEGVVRASPICLGMVFSSDNWGVNAISEAIARGCPVYLPPEDHESPLFNNWHCFSVPLIVGGEIVGYLDVSTINADMKSELIAIAKLIPADMLTSYQILLADHTAEQHPNPLSGRQLKVLKLIAQGLTGRAIASRLNIKECTVNHHKRVIFEKLGVQSSSEAVSVASRMLML